MRSRVLVIEDNIAYARFASESIEQGMSASVEVVEGPHDAVGRLRSGDVDVAVLDLDICSGRGFEKFQHLSGVAPRVPIVVVTSDPDPAMESEFLRNGAQEYLIKGSMHARSLATAVRHAADRHTYRDVLRTTEARFRSLVEGAVQGILIHVDGVVQFANRALADLVGVACPEDFVGHEIWPFIAEEDRPLVTQYAQNRLRGGAAPSRYELRVVRSDGSIRWVDCAVSVISWDGSITIMAALVDVTDRRQAVERLRASEERFQLLADNVKEAMIVVEIPSGRPLYLSRVWEEIWGRRIEDAYRNPDLWSEAIDQADQSAVEDARARLLQGEEATTTFRLHRPDGTMCWVRARLFPVRDENQRVYRVVGLMEDITAMRRTEEQLRQAMKMEAIGRLAGGVAHDFNNLLVAIRGYADLTAEALGPTHELRGDIDEIRAAATSAANLTRQLLTFSRHQIVQPEILDLNSVLVRVESLLRRVLGEDVRLTIRLGEALDRVHADAGQIEQIIMNLSVNARDAMPDGGELVIETGNVELDEVFTAQHRGALPGPHVAISVSDTGTGMDEATQQRLFEPFFTTKPIGRGTGLGLSTVYGIVSQSHGIISVYSEIGRGSTFRVYLPARTDYSDPTRSVSCVARRITGSETVLVVEDQAEVRRLVTETLQRHGYRPLPSANLSEALGLAREYAVDLLLTDVVLERESGRNVAKRILAEWPHVRVLYMSGYTDDVVLHHGVLDPALAFLQKPFTTDTLLTKIRDVIDAQVSPAY